MHDKEIERNSNKREKSKKEKECRITCILNDIAANRTAYDIRGAVYGREEHHGGCRSTAAMRHAKQNA